MQINLKAHNAESLEFKAKITLTADLIANIHKISAPDDDGDSPFLDSYENHRAIVWVKKADEKTFQSEIEFVYQARKGGRLRKKIPRVSQLINLLVPIDQKLTFECEASFLFRKRARAKSTYPLPQRSLDLPDMPFDRIQGMHFVKLNGLETKYDVFLEIPTRGVIIENIVFKYSSKVNSNLANNILVEALNISKKFVVKEQ